jgi:hypothetical protein
MEMCDDPFVTTGMLVREKHNGRIFTVDGISCQMVMMTHDRIMFLTPVGQFHQVMQLLE